jgi:uncharacterized membrane protein YhiD involved in acid resistance
MMQDFQYIELFPITSLEILYSLSVSFVCGVIISVVYRVTYKGPNYSRTFVSSLIVLTIITSLVLLVIGNNLARAFGLVGAMSIIRFRTAVRDVQDIVFIFFSLGIGMASGGGQYLVAVIGTVFISLVLLLLSNTNVFQTASVNYLIHITYKPNDTNDQVKKLLKSSTNSLKVVNVRALDDKDFIEVYYNMKLKNGVEKEVLIRKLKNLDDVRDINIYFDDDDMNSPTGY